jgi:hypothetical protein
MYYSNKKFRFYFIIFFLFIFLLNSIFAQTSFLSKDDSGKKFIEKFNIDNTINYNDLLYPPEKYLKLQDQNLEQYKESLRENAQENRNSTVPNLIGTCPKTGNIHLPVLLLEFTDNISTIDTEEIDLAFV